MAELRVSHQCLGMNTWTRPQVYGLINTSCIRPVSTIDARYSICAGHVPVWHEKNKLPAITTHYCRLIIVFHEPPISHVLVCHDSKYMVHISGDTPSTAPPSISILVGVLHSCSNTVGGVWRRCASSGLTKQRCARG